jgi:hypothetical protein
MADKNLQPKLPLQLDSNGSFINITDILESAKQKLRMVILTNQGEKLMDPNFGVGIEKYLFENSNSRVQFNYNSLGNLESIDSENYQQIISSEILKQAQLYVSEINISNIQVIIDENLLKILINYNLLDFLEDTLELNVGA